MMRENIYKQAYEYSYEEIENVSNNILKKMSQLGVTLPELSKMMGMEYQTLWRITYQKEKYVPNLRALFPIADFFNITVGDLLKNPNMPQYIPLLKIGEINNYLSINTAHKSKSLATVFCNEYIHEKAFAISITPNYWGIQTQVVYVCKPCSKINIDQHIVFSDKSGNPFFAKITSINEDAVKCLAIETGEVFEVKIDSINILAIAIKQVVNNDLL